MTRPPAPDLSADEAARVAEFEAAPVIEEAWQEPHADDCTREMRREGMYAADCQRCEDAAQWLDWYVRNPR